MGIPPFDPQLRPKMTDWSTHEERLRFLEAYMRRQERKCSPAPAAKVQEYATVFEQPDRFDAEVNHRLQQGWVILGHMVVHPVSGFFCLGMTRYPQRED